MVASPMFFFFVALVQISEASRYHPLVQPPGLQAVDGLAPHGPGRALAPHSLLRDIDPERRALTDDATKVWKPDLKEDWRAGLPFGLQEFDLSEDIRPSRVPRPPPTVVPVLSIDMKKLLQTWGGSRWEKGARQLVYKRAFLDSDWQGKDRSDQQDLQKAYDWALREGFGDDWTKAGLPEYWKDMLFLLQKMDGDFAKLQGYDLFRSINDTDHVASPVPTIYQPFFDKRSLKRRKWRRYEPYKVNWRLGQSGVLETIGLISNEQFSPISASPAADPGAAVLALVSFSRQQLKDNSVYHERASEGLLPAKFVKKGPSPLSRIVEEQLGIRATRGLFGRRKKRFPVFAIEGLADSPDLLFHTDVAKVLLAKIVKWAQSEQRLLVVARHAVRFQDGTDLTDFYMGLGFQKVDNSDGSYDLVYSGISVPDTGASTSTSMVRLGAWALDYTR